MERPNATQPGFDGMPARAFTLLRSLGRDNTSDWMRGHRAPLLQHLRDPFIRYLQATTMRLREEGFDLSGGEDTVFRMQRDLRFTRDRRPFHEHIEAVLSKGGVRIGTRASIHVRLDPSGGFLRAGSFLQPTAALRALRESMVAREDRFLRLAGDLEEAGCGLASAKTLQRPPRGFERVESGPLGKYLKLLDPLAGRSLDVSDWRSGSVVEETVEFARTVRPWLLFVREALHPLGKTAPERPPRSPGAGINNSSWG